MSPVPRAPAHPPDSGFPQAAAFCYEELVLVSPSDHVVHSRLGELYYTMGGES